MKQKRISRTVPVIGTPDEIMPEDDSHLTGEEYMNVRFGPGTWVRDSFEDVFVTYDVSYDGPGIGYLIIDRNRRRRTAIVMPNRLN